MSFRLGFSFCADSTIVIVLVVEILASIFHGTAAKWFRPSPFGTLTSVESFPSRAVYSEVLGSAVLRLDVANQAA